MQNFQSYQRTYCTAEPLGHIIQDGNTFLEKYTRVVMERVKSQVRGNENAIIISACYWDFLHVTFHYSIAHRCPIGSTYWAFVGTTYLNIMTVIQSVLLHFTTLCVENHVLTF